MKIFRFLLVASLLLVMTHREAQAGVCAVTALPVTGTLTASRLNARYSQIESCVNGRLDSPVALNELASAYSYTAVSAQIPCTTQADAFMTRVPYQARLSNVMVRCLGCSSADYDIDVQIGGTNSIQFVGIADGTMQTSTGTDTVTTSQDVAVDVTQNTAGSCSSLDVTMWFKITHTSL